MEKSEVERKSNPTSHQRLAEGHNASAQATVVKIFATGFASQISSWQSGTTAPAPSPSG